MTCAAKTPSQTLMGGHGGTNVVDPLVAALLSRVPGACAVAKGLCCLNDRRLMGRASPVLPRSARLNSREISQEIA